MPEKEKPKARISLDEEGRLFLRRPGEKGMPTRRRIFKAPEEGPAQAVMGREPLLRHKEEILRALEQTRTKIQELEQELRWTEQELEFDREHTEQKEESK